MKKFSEITSLRLDVSSVKLVIIGF